jgi:FSR family fosmidomycin resistance protein-like MFS transporter
MSRRTTLAMSCLAHAVQDGMTATIYVLLPVLAQSLGLNLSEVGLFKGLKGFAQGMLEIASGFLSERFGDKTLLVSGLVLSGAGYMLFSLAGGPLLVMVCLIIVGIGTAFQHAPSSSLVSAAYTDGRRRSALGLYNSSGDAGKLIFSATFSLTIGAGLAWSFTTFAFGLICVLAALVLLRFLKASGTARSHAEDTKADAPRKGWGIMDRTGFSALLVVTSLDNLVQAAAATFVAFLMLEKGLPLSIAAFAAPVTLVGGMFGKAACGYLADRIGPRPAFTLVQILTAVGLIGVVLIPGLASYLLLPFLGIFLQGSSSITYSMVNDFVHPDRISRGFALIYGSGSFASVAGPVGTGIIGDAHSVGMAMYALAGVSVLAILPCIWMRVSPSRF